MLLGIQIAVKRSKVNVAIICPLIFKTFSFISAPARRNVTNKRSGTRRSSKWKELALILNSSFCCLTNYVRIVLSLKT